VKAIHPGYGVGDIAKELGKRWEVCPNKPKFEALAVKDKERYERVCNNLLHIRIRRFFVKIIFFCKYNIIQAVMYFL